MSANAIRQVFRALVSAFDQITLTSGDVLQSDTQKSDANPRVQWRTGSWESVEFDPFKTLVTWNVPATLTVQGEAGSTDAIQNAANDLYDWCALVTGLPVDAGGFIIPYSAKQLALSARGKLFSIAERFRGPIINRVSVRPSEGDGSFSIADLVVLVEFMVDSQPLCNRTVSLVTLGVNILDPMCRNLLIDPNAPYTLPAPTSDDTISWGAFQGSEPAITYAGQPVRAGFPPVPGGIPILDGGAPGQAFREINVLPRAATVATTAQLTALGIRQDMSSADLTQVAAWATSDATKATVAAGLVTRVGAGSATITATYNGVSNTAAITTT